MSYRKVPSIPPGRRLRSEPAARCLARVACRSPFAFFRFPRELTLCGRAELGMPIDLGQSRSRRFGARRGSFAIGPLSVGRFGALSRLEPHLGVLCVRGEPA